MVWATALCFAVPVVVLVFPRLEVCTIVLKFLRFLYVFIVVLVCFFLVCFFGLFFLCFFFLNNSDGHILRTSFFPKFRNLFLEHQNNYT